VAYFYTYLGCTRLTPTSAVGSAVSHGFLVIQYGQRVQRVFSADRGQGIARCGAHADLVLHIHRELIHHLSEVCLLRDLYLHTKPATNGATR
jgi:hypothetical protein